MSLKRDLALERLGDKIKELIPHESEMLLINDISDLVRLAKLDPKKDFQFTNWSGIDFKNSDIRGFDFTGANLSDCDFTDALIEGAVFDIAIINRTNIRQAKDWVQLLLKTRPNPRQLPTDHLENFFVFQDAIFTPEMVKIPAGDYKRGSTFSDRNTNKNEQPQERVAIAYDFAVSRYPITFNEWDFASKRGGCEKFVPSDGGLGRGWNPVINISWSQAKSYTDWLSKNTGEDYRLLSEAEWEYCCRAGSDDDYCFGSGARELKEYAWYGENSNARLHPVGQKKPNKFGLYDMHGNVWEWCRDHWHNNYRDAPKNGNAWVNPGIDFNYPRVMRGGSWRSSSAEDLRSARRSKINAGYRYNGIGFRVARNLR
ncbi:MAG: SUMF1/EgtB/PvdO family nonheme iron enzyme [Methyloligellaceae bacterium]